MSTKTVLKAIGWEIGKALWVALMGLSIGASAVNFVIFLVQFLFLEVSPLTVVLLFILPIPAIMYHRKAIAAVWRGYVDGVIKRYETRNDPKPKSKSRDPWGTNRW
jgi:hypothetical protein